MMSPEGEGSLPGQKQDPNLGALFNIIAKVVAGTTAPYARQVFKSREEIRNAFTTSALYILRRLPRPFSGLLRISSIRRIFLDESATLEPNRLAYSESRVEDHRQRPRHLAL